MYITYGSERIHTFRCFIDDDSILKYKTTERNKDALNYSIRYYIEKIGEFKITILERDNNKIFRLFFNIIAGIILFAGGSDLNEYYSIKYNKGKLVLKVISNNLEDEIDIRQLMKNPPFEIKTIKGDDTFKYDILFNGRFKNKFKDEVSKITGVNKCVK